MKRFVHLAIIYYQTEEAAQGPRGLVGSESDAGAL